VKQAEFLIFTPWNICCVRERERGDAPGDANNDNAKEDEG
jgi:hypothetical protein